MGGIGRAVLDALLQRLVSKFGLILVVIELAEQIIEACAVGGGHGFHSLGQMRQSLFVAFLAYEHVRLSQFCHFAQTRRQRVAHGFGKSIFGIVKPSHLRIAACQPKACLSRHFGFGGIEARDVRKGGGGFEKLARLELRPPHHQPRMFEERIELFALQISLFLGREGLAGGLRGAFLNGMNLNGFLRFRNRGFKIRLSQAARCLIAHTEYGQRLREIVLVALLLRLDALFVSLLPVEIGVEMGVEGVPKAAQRRVLLRRARRQQQKDEGNIYKRTSFHEYGFRNQDNIIYINLEKGVLLPLP